MLKKPLLYIYIAWPTVRGMSTIKQKLIIDSKLGGLIKFCGGAVV